MQKILTFLVENRVENIFELILSERSYGPPLPAIRNSIYREVLFLLMTACGNGTIDLGIFTWNFPILFSHSAVYRTFHWNWNCFSLFYLLILRIKLLLYEYVHNYRRLWSRVSARVRGSAAPAGWANDAQPLRLRTGARQLPSQSRTAALTLRLAAFDARHRLSAHQLSTLAHSLVMN